LPLPNGFQPEGVVRSASSARLGWSSTKRAAGSTVFLGFGRRRTTSSGLNVLHRNFLDRRADESEEPVLRPYAHTHLAELFAVATEAFFEKPQTLATALPDLYLKLKRFYGSDPRAM
jgi:hypothetical protein